MQNFKKFGIVGKTTISFAASVFLSLVGFSLNGADYDGWKIQWKLDTGLEKDRFEGNYGGTAKLRYARRGHLTVPFWQIDQAGYLMG
tara:strand:+ start:209 stop:469 length:261 start_codon:yes stop_codon:yes gene_type:complete